MLISEFLAKNKLSDTIIKSIIYNTVIEVFKNEKNIDLNNYLSSIILNWKTILIKTNKPLINSELILLNDKIITNITNKFERMNFNFKWYEIKYK